MKKKDRPAGTHPNILSAISATTVRPMLDEISGGQLSLAMAREKKQRVKKQTDTIVGTMQGIRFRFEGQD